MVDLLLVRRLPPLHANVGKRLVKSPKIFLRDIGLVHTLLRLIAWSRSWDIRLPERVGKGT